MLAGMQTNSPDYAPTAADAGPIHSSESGSLRAVDSSGESSEYRLEGGHLIAVDSSSNKPEIASDIAT
jgi:hypothetical protein